MTETSFPFKQPASDNPFGRIMPEKQWAAGFRYMLDTGIMAAAFNDSLNQCPVTPDPAIALTVNVDTGAAFIQGFWYINDAVKAITIPPNNTSGTRADRIVLELDWGLNAGIHAVYVTGDNGVVYPSSDSRSGQPMPKDLVMTYGSKWQVPLCQINVPQGTTLLTSSNVTFIDQRKFVGNGGAQPYAVVVAMGNASNKMRANADFQIPATAGFADAGSTIADAFDALPACGGTVMLSEGDCIASGSIVPPANSDLIGCGSQSTITLGAAGAAAPLLNIAQNGTTIQDLTLIGNGLGYVIDVESVSNVRLRGLTVDGGAGSTLATGIAGRDGIFMNNCNVTTIKDCQIQNCKGNGVQFFATLSDPSAAWGNWIESCYLIGNWGSGIRTSANSGLIQNNQVVKNGGYGIYLVSDITTGPDGQNWGASINVVSNNSVRLNQGHGIFLDSRSASGTHGNVSQNVISDNLLSNNGAASPGGMYNLLADGGFTINNLITGNHCSSWAVANMQDMWATDITAENFFIGNFCPHLCFIEGNNCAKHNFYTHADCG